MANVCVYHAVIKGKKNNVYCMAASLPELDNFEYVDEYGTDEKLTLLVKGTCKWTLSAYTRVKEGLTKIDVPQTIDEAQLLGGKLEGTAYSQLANLLDVTMISAEFDADDFFGINEDEYGKPVELSESEREFLYMIDELDFYGIDPESAFDDMDEMLEEDEDLEE